MTFLPLAPAETTSTSSIADPVLWAITFGGVVLLLAFDMVLTRGRTRCR
ncbi:hypothetical protein [Serinicoccus marinus]|nr:hypothetical protein [Serinicoccus marinus]